MELVTEHTVLEVGKFYKVRCAKLVRRWDGHILDYTPIFGKPHTDIQLGVKFEHYHVDGRFTPNGWNYFNVDSLGRTNHVVNAIKDDTQFSFVEEIVILKRKCKRLTTGIKPPAIRDSYDAWYNTMIGKSCKGKRCPHLGTVMMEQNGILICPLHNLKGCVENEVIIKQMDR